MPLSDKVQPQTRDYLVKPNASVPGVLEARIVEPDYSFKLCKSEEEEVCRFNFNGPTLVFTGDADNGAKVFIEYAMSCFVGRMKEEYDRGYAAAQRDHASALSVTDTTTQTAG